MQQKSLGLIETEGLAAGVEAADAAVKSANVELVGYELTKGGGWTTVKIQGDVGAVKAAVDAARIAAQKVNRVVSTRVIARPSDSLEGLIRNGDTVGVPPAEPERGPEPPDDPVPPQEPVPPAQTEEAEESAPAAPAEESGMPQQEEASTAEAGTPSQEAEAPAEGDPAEGDAVPQEAEADAKASAEPRETAGEAAPRKGGRKSKGGRGR